MTRNYLPQLKEEPLIRDCCLLPWFPDKLTDKEWLEQLSSEFTLEYAKKQLSDVQMKVCIYFSVFSVKMDCNLKKRGQLLSLTAVLLKSVQNLIMLCLIVYSNLISLFWGYIFCLYLTKKRGDHYDITPLILNLSLPNRLEQSRLNILLTPGCALSKQPICNRPVTKMCMSQTN